MRRSAPKIRPVFIIVLVTVLIRAASAAERAESSGTAAKCEPGLVLPVWQPQDNLSVSDRVFRGIVYLVSLIYFFLGVSIVSDRFMGAIEVITSQEREMVIRKKGADEGQRIKVRVWNETVANLTLMALGSSAPEILLSVIEIAGKNFVAGDLGPGTIVGSAAYNLFVIIALCVSVIPDGEVRKIKHLSVFFVTAFWSIFAYIWLYLILAVISADVVECWEGLLTFMFFPATVLTAYVADRKFKLFKCKKFRLDKHNVIVAAESGEVEIEKEIEDEILEESCITDPHHFAIVYRNLKKRNSSATANELEKLAIDELVKRTHKSKAFYRLQAHMNITGGVAVTTHPKKEVVDPHDNEEPSGSLKATRIYFQPDFYSVLECVGDFDVTVVRESADLSQTVIVLYATEDGTAVAGTDYEGVNGTMAFMPGETVKTIRIRIIDDEIFEEDEHFYLHLTRAMIYRENCDEDFESAENKSIIVLEPSTATIVVMDDDHCGVFGFIRERVEISETVGVYRLEAIRSSGARGRVSVDYKMIESTAKNGRHFTMQSGSLVFENNEARKKVDIEIVDENCYEKNVSFFVLLANPKELKSESNDGKDSDNDPINLKDDGKTKPSGKPKLSAISRIEIIIRESDEFKNTVNKLVEQEGPAVGFSSWSEQFSNAFRVKIEEDETDKNAELHWCDYFTHFITFFWKLLFAFVPPADLFSGYLCFLVSIFFIGVLTAVIGDLASHFGCTVGLKDSVTAVTFVALGTSVPDTFASKVAAIQDSTADNSVGNVTGSNAVNVFLGIGIAWSLASIYHKSHNRQFQVKAGNLAFCVTLYCIEAFIAVIILLLRRSKTIGGELGGPKFTKYLTSIVLTTLWIIYVTMTTLEAYGAFEK